MIGFLEGQILLVTEDAAYLNVNGVGYEVACAKHHMDEWRLSLGQRLQLWIYTHVREDALILFGFPTMEEKSFFLSLLKVNGIGPKMALSILSGASLPELTRMIESSNAKALSALPKVGKKTAEQMILTLKGKLVEIEKAQQPLQRHMEVISALVNLGFRTQIVEEFVATLPDQLGVEEGVRQGLVALTQVGSNRKP